MRCLPWQHNWTKWRPAKYLTYPNLNPLRSYSGPAKDLYKQIEVSRNERTCKRCGITKTKAL
jgi:hypothetical protein